MKYDKHVVFTFKCDDCGATITSDKSKLFMAAAEARHRGWRVREWGNLCPRCLAFRKKK